jgi:tetrahydromethanopterin S-methyltransferase subunit C
MARTVNRPLLSGTFWLDTLERCIKTAAQTALALVGVEVVDVASLDWQEILIAVGFATGLSVLTSIVSSGIGEPGSASLLNPAPPDTLKEPAVG